MRFFGDSRFTYIFFLQHFIDFDSNKLVTLNIMFHNIIFLLCHPILLFIHEIVTDKFINFIFGPLNILLNFFGLLVSLLINCFLFLLFEILQYVAQFLDIDHYLFTSIRLIIIFTLNGFLFLGLDLHQFIVHKFIFLLIYRFCIH